MHTDSGMTGISLSGYMPYMTVASLEMSDEPKKRRHPFQTPSFFISIRPKLYKPNLGNITFSSPSAKTASRSSPS